MKTFAAMTTGGYVLFTVEAKNTVEAKATVQSVKRRSDTVTGVRLLKADDRGMFGAAIEKRA